MNTHQSAECGVRSAELRTFLLRTPNSELRTQHGSVLLYVVWAIALLSLFAASIGSRAIFSLGLTERFTDQLRAVYLARGAAHYAALTLAQDDTATVDGLSDAWANSPGRFQDRPLGAGWFQITSQEPGEVERRYGLSDEERRVNLNTAPAEVLQRLFELAGLREDEAVALAAAVEDWRDADDREEPHGAEGIYYRSLPDGYDCHDGLFEHVEELLLVRGVTPELYRRLEPHVTVYGSGRLNLNTATPIALASLGMSQIGLDGFLAYRAGDDGRDGTGDERRLVSTAQLSSELAAFVPAEDLARLTALAEAGFLGVGSSVFRMTIDARLARAASGMTVECVMQRDGTIGVWEER